MAKGQAGLQAPGVSTGWKGSFGPGAGERERSPSQGWGTRVWARHSPSQGTRQLAAGSLFHFRFPVGVTSGQGGGPRGGEWAERVLREAGQSGGAAGGEAQAGPRESSVAFLLASRSLPCPQYLIS